MGQYDKLAGDCTEPKAYTPRWHPDALVTGRAAMRGDEADDSNRRDDR
jgi:hypothetical protein